MQRFENQDLPELTSLNYSDDEMTSVAGTVAYFIISWGSVSPPTVISLTTEI